MCCLSVVFNSRLSESAACSGFSIKRCEKKKKLGLNNKRTHEYLSSRLSIGSSQFTECCSGVATPLENRFFSVDSHSQPSSLHEALQATACMSHSPLSDVHALTALHLKQSSTAQVDDLPLPHTWLCLTHSVLLLTFWSGMGWIKVGY